MQLLEATWDNGEDGATIMKRLIRTNAGAGCGPCGPPTATHLDNIAIWLDKVKTFTDNHSTTPGFQNVMKSIGANQFYNVDAASQLFRIIENHSGDPVDIAYGITQFEPPLGDLTEEALAILGNADDIDVDVYGLPSSYFTNSNIGDYIKGTFPNEAATLVELKSYKLSSIDKITINSKFQKQFKAYWDNDYVTSVDKMIYVFDAKKLIGAGAEQFNNIDEAKEYLIGLFKEVYLSNADDIFNSIRTKPMLSNEVFGDVVDDSIARDLFESYVNDPGSTLYNFINVF